MNTYDTDRGRFTYHNSRWMHKEIICHLTVELKGLQSQPLIRDGSLHQRSGGCDVDRLTSRRARRRQTDAVRSCKTVNTQNTIILAKYPKNEGKSSLCQLRFDRSTE